MHDLLANPWDHEVAARDRVLPLLAKKVLGHQDVNVGRRGVAILVLEEHDGTRVLLSVGSYTATMSEYDGSRWLRWEADTTLASETCSLTYHVQAVRAGSL